MDIKAPSYARHRDALTAWSFAVHVIDLLAGNTWDYVCAHLVVDESFWKELTAKYKSPD